MRLPNGYGSIVNLGKKRRRPFAVRITTGWDKDKKQKYKYIAYFEKKTDALAFLVEYNEKGKHERLDSKMTLKEVYDQWSKRHLPKVAPNSKKAYVGRFKKCEHLYNYRMSELRTYHFQDIVDEMETTSTARTFKNVIKMLYDFAIENDILEKEYASYIMLPKNKTKYKKTPFTIDEINAIWKREGEETADAILILLYTGMRISELLLMKTKDIYLKERYMIGGLKSENGTDRTIPIHKKLIPIIEKHLNDKKYLFEYEGAEIKYDTFHERTEKLFSELGFKHTLHETRHTFISQADRLGMNQVCLKKIVGHSTKVDMTNGTYNHKNLNDLIEAIDILEYV